MDSVNRPANPPSVWNLPNQITLARLVLTLVMFVLLALGPGWIVHSLVVFLLAALTDKLDGYLARKYNLITQLGRQLDPFADKLLICGAFIFLAAEPHSGIAPWMAVLVMGRELLVTAIRAFLEQQGADFSASFSGKLKMVFQCAAVVASMLVLAHTQSPPAWLEWTLWVSVWVTVVSTVQSGLEYLLAAARLMSVAPQSGTSD